MKKRFIKFLYALDCYLLYLLSGVISSALVVAFCSANAAYEYGSLGAEMDSAGFGDYMADFLVGKSSVVLLVSFGIIVFSLVVFFLIRRKNLITYTGMNYLKPMSLVGSAVAGVALNLLSYAFVPDVDHSGGEFGIVLILCVILSPFIEELVFRGVLFKMFKSAVGVIGAILVTSVLFAIAHGGIVQIMYTAVLGVVLCIVRVRSTSLWSAFVLHFAYNAAGIISALVSPSFSATGIALLICATLLSLMVACGEGRKKRKKEKVRDA